MRYKFIDLNNSILIYYFPAKLFCANAPQIRDGELIYTSNNVGSSATLYCNYPYYVTSGSDLYTCSNSTSWIGKGTCGNKILFMKFKHKDNNIDNNITCQKINPKIEFNCIPYDLGKSFLLQQ